MSISLEHQEALSDVELAIFDVDQTLVFPSDASFYSKYGDAVRGTIATHFNVEPDKAKEIANFYKSEYGGSEQALFKGNVHLHFPGIMARTADVALLYDSLAAIDPTDLFPVQTEVREGLTSLRDAGVSVAALTSSPDVLSRAILKEAGYKPDEDFDMFVAYDRKNGPPKMIDAERVFGRVANEFGVAYTKTLAIGDSFGHDIAPAAALGMQTCWLSQQEAPAGYSGMTVAHPLEIISALRHAVAHRAV